MPSPTHPIAAVSAAVIRDDHVLLVRRGHPPNRGAWTFPGGKIHPGETLRQAAERETREETGVVITAREPFFVFDLIERDDKNELRHHYVITVVSADHIAGEPAAASDADDARWVPLRSLELILLHPPLPLAGEGRGEGISGRELEKSTSKIHIITPGTRDALRALPRSGKIKIP